ncbi:MAG: hypothetical protein E6J20_02145 [Chloroflexi bacterium]|nr:MAG: hypothetical protein E6J20_02145 [Chloroflexota bacterium]
MASAVLLPKSQGKERIDLAGRPYLAFLWAAFLTALIAGPWLLPGYLFGTDWPGPRRFEFPSSASSEMVLYAVLALASRVLGGELTSKLFVLGALFASAALAYRAVPSKGFLSGAAAATIYVANPFVYGRLHYGQFFVLAAYAALPWMALRLRRLVGEPGVGTALVAALSLAVLGVLSLHFLLIAGVLYVAVVVAYVLAARPMLPYLKRLVAPLVIMFLAVFAASAYWVVPLLRGTNSEGARLAGIGLGDLNAFAAIPDRSLGIVPNLLGLYGFWAEATGRFTSMKAFVPAWPAALGVLLILCGVGAFAALRDRDQGLAPWVLGLLAGAIAALILEIGISYPLTARIVQWLYAEIPTYRGMRDAGKWGAMLALVYSQLVGFGAVAILAWLKKRVRDPVGSEWVAGFAAALVLALPLYCGNGLLFGAHGEIKPSAYPAGWYAADRLLSSDTHPGRTLVLPWHEYMSYSFVQNRNNVIASPAPGFFSVPVLVSADPEVPGISPPQDPDQLVVSGLVRDGAKGDWGQVLAAYGVKYVVLTREVDWHSYAFLDTQPGLTKVGDYESIVIYAIHPQA